MKTKKEESLAGPETPLFLFSYLNSILSSILPRPEKQGRHDGNKPYDH